MTGKRVLSKNDIRNAKPLSTVEVEMPEWDGVVILREMTGAARDRMENEIAKRRNGNAINMEGLRPMLIILCAVDAEGKPLFTEDDATWLNEEKSATAIERLFDVAQKLNKIGTDAVQAEVGN